MYKHTHVRTAIISVPAKLTHTHLFMHPRARTGSCYHHFWHSRCRHGRHPERWQVAHLPALCSPAIHDLRRTGCVLWYVGLSHLALRDVARYSSQVAPAALAYS